MVPAEIPTGMRGYFRGGRCGRGVAGRGQEHGQGLAGGVAPLDDDAMYADRITVHDTLYVEVNIDVDGTMSADGQPSLSRYRTTDVNISTVDVDIARVPHRRKR